MQKTHITEVNIYPVKPTNGLIAFASCLFDGKLALNSIAVHTTLDGDIRLVFENKLLPNGKEINVFYPVNKQTYESIKKAIIKKFENVTKKVGEKYNESSRSKKSF